MSLRDVKTSNHEAREALKLLTFPGRGQGEGELEKSPRMRVVIVVGTREDGLVTLVACPAALFFPWMR
jgi:hypothetical protein